MATKFKDKYTVYQSKINLNGEDKYLTTIHLPDFEEEDVDVSNICIIDTKYTTSESLIKFIKAVSLNSNCDKLIICNNPSITFDDVIGINLKITLTSDSVASVLRSCINDICQITLYTDYNNYDDLSINGPVSLYGVFNIVCIGNYVDCDEYQTIVNKVNPVGTTCHVSSLYDGVKIWNSNVKSSYDYFSSDSGFLDIDANLTTSDKVVFVNNSRRVMPLDRFYTTTSHNKIVMLTSDPDPDLSITDFSSSLRSHYDFSLADYYFENKEFKKIPSIQILTNMYILAYGTAESDFNFSSMIIDSYLEDKVLHFARVDAFTPADKFEYINKMLKKAAFYSADRHPHTLESDDVSKKSVLEILQFLSDHKSEFTYLHNKTKYNPISLSTDPVMNVHDVSASSMITDLVFNDKRINASLRFVMNGSTTIGDKDAKDFHLNQNLSVKIYRTHTIIKDGYLNVPSITIKPMNAKFNSELYKFLGMRARISRGGRVFESVTIHLQDYPIYSNADLDDQTSAESIYHCVTSLTKLKCASKAVDYILKTHKNSSDNENSFSLYTADQIKMLKRYGMSVSGNDIIYSGFDHKHVDEQESSTETVPCFRLYQKGFSTIPSMNSVLSSNPNSKSKVISCMRQYYDDYSGYSESELMKIKMQLKQEIDNLSARLFRIRAFFVLNGILPYSFINYSSKNDNELYYQDLVADYSYKVRRIHRVIN